LQLHGKKIPSLAGLIATMLLTSLIVLAWLYTDNKENYDLLAKYSKGALMGILLILLLGCFIVKEEGFLTLKTKHCVIFYQEGVSRDRACEVGRDFEIGYKVVGEDLGYPKKTPKLYVYRSIDALFDDLITRRGYSAGGMKKYPGLPAMNWNYQEWVPPKAGIRIIVHEYAHRIIQQITGFNSVQKFKWFDEGLAEYEGLKALRVKDQKAALAIEKIWLKNVVFAYKNNTLISFKNMMTMEQWRSYSGSKWKSYFGTNSIPGLINYEQSAVAVSFLINQYGFDKIKKLLIMVGKGKSFPSAFQKVYNLSIEEFEERFKAYLDSLKDEF
jgi:hypothetical protein